MLRDSERNLKARREAGEAVPQALARAPTGVERNPKDARFAERRACGSYHFVARENHLDPSLLRRLKTLSWMSDEQHEQLFRGAETRRIPRPRTIFSEGGASNRVYIMLSGVAKLSILNRQERVLVGLIGPGEVFGVSSLLPNATRPFRCDAFTDCTVAIVQPDVFVDATLKVSLEILSQVLDVTVGRWWMMLLRYANFIGLGLRERLAAALLEVGNKFGVEDSRGVLLTLKVTHEDLADLVGASRQRTTVQLKEFEREHALIRDGRRMIIVPRKLRPRDGERIASEQSFVASVAQGRIVHVRQQVHHHQRSQAALHRPRNGR
jgi:CRP/FNR family cyclic AMP-dependent transcriptional regulator